MANVMLKNSEKKNDLKLTSNGHRFGTSPVDKQLFGMAVYTKFVSLRGFANDNKIINVACVRNSL